MRGDRSGVDTLLEAMARGNPSPRTYLIAAATLAWKKGAPSSEPFFGSVFTITIISLLAISLLREY